MAQRKFIASGTLLALMLALGGLLAAFIADRYRADHPPYQSPTTAEQK